MDDNSISFLKLFFFKLRVFAYKLNICLETNSQEFELFLMEHKKNNKIKTKYLDTIMGDFLEKNCAPVTKIHLEAHKHLF